MSQEKGKIAYLNNAKTRDIMKQIRKFFESYIEVPRMKVGKKQTLETLLNEEAFLFAKYLRNEQRMWIPRIKISHTNL